MGKWFPSCTKIFTATACFWSNPLCEQLHDRPNVYVLSKCNQANPSVAGFGDLVHDMRVISSRNASGGVATQWSYDKAAGLLIYVCLHLQGCLCLPLPAAVHANVVKRILCFPHRAVRLRRAHWHQPQALVVGSESFSLPGMVSFTLLLLNFIPNLSARPLILFFVLQWTCLQWCPPGPEDKGQRDCRHVFTCWWVNSRCRSRPFVCKGFCIRCSFKHYNSRLKGPQLQLQ